MGVEANVGCILLLIVNRCVHIRSIVGFATH
jgi:hypothetical protein